MVYVNDTALEEPYLYADEPGDAAQPTTGSAGALGRCPTGELFLMGDHRANSADSRSFGPVPIANIIGRAWLRYWPINVFGILPTPTHPELETAESMNVGAVNPALAGVALAVVLGAVVATSARNARHRRPRPRLRLIGAAFVADPLPDSLGLAARLVGTVLGGYLLWIAAPRARAPATGGSRLGWPAELLIAAGAAVVGYGSHGLGAPALGPALGQAAGFRPRGPGRRPDRQRPRHPARGHRPDPPQPRARSSSGRRSAARPIRSSSSSSPVSSRSWAAWWR